MAYLWGASPPSSLSFSSCHCAPFLPFSSSLCSLVSPLSYVFIHLISSSLSHFLPPSPNFISVSISTRLLSTPVLPHSFTRLCLLSSSVFHFIPLSLSFQSPLPSHLHLPSSLQFIPASVHLFIFLFVASFQYLPPSNLHAQLLILSLLFADLFNSSSLFLPAPPFFVTRLHFRLLLCVCSSVTFLMDFFGWTGSKKYFKKSICLGCEVEVRTGWRFDTESLRLTSVFIHPDGIICQWSGRVQSRRVPTTTTTTRPSISNLVLKEDTSFPLTAARFTS